MFLSVFAMAQSDTTNSDLKINQVEVIKAFEANLQEAQKIRLKSVLPDQKPFNPTYKYDITIVPIDLKFPDPVIKPLAMAPDAPFKINNGYLQGGYGFRKNPELMAGYHFAKKDAYDVGFHLQYESLNNATKIPYQQYRNATADIYGNYMLKENMNLYGEVNSSFRKRYLYQTDIGVDTLYTKEQSERSLNGYGIKAGIRNAEPTKYNFNYDIYLALDNLSITNSNIRENGIIAGLMGEKLFKKSSVLSVEAKYDYTALNAQKELSLTTSTFKPVLKTKIKNLILQVGANMLYSSDNRSSVFPEVYVSYGVSGPALQVFGGVSQDYYVNNFRNVTLRNPYLANTQDSLVNTVSHKYYGGIKGQYSFITYQVSAGLKDANRLMFLLNQRSDVRYFDMVYGDAKIAFVAGNVDFALTDVISLGGSITQNVFKLKDITNAWHTPNIEGSAYGLARLLNGKLELNANLYFGNKVLFLNKENQAENSNALFDMNIGAQYSVSKKFSLFIKGINLLDNKFERWYGYQSVGINGLAGIRIIF